MICEYCGREERKATASNLIGITWLNPDMRWICSHCLKKKSRRIIKPFD